MEKTNPKYRSYIQILEEELVPFVHGLTSLGWPAPERTAVRATIGYMLEDAYTMLTGDSDPARRAREAVKIPRRGGAVENGGKVGSGVLSRSGIQHSIAAEQGLLGLSLFPLGPTARSPTPTPWAW